MIRNIGRRAGRGAAFVAAIAFLVGGLAVPAQASEEEQHCIILLDDGTVECASTLEGADAAFTAATGYTRAETTAGRGDASALLVVSLATLYTNASYGGSSYTFTGTFACDGTTAVGVTSLSSVGLDNAVSSFLTYGSCTVRLYDGTSYTGTYYGYTTSKSSLPTFNDVASSARVR